MFNPKIKFDNAYSLGYLKGFNSDSIVEYKIKFTVNNSDSITLKETEVTFSNKGSQTFNNSDVLNISNYIDNKKIASKKKDVQLEKELAKQKEERMAREGEFFEECLSSYDGSHKGLVELVKSNMNDPNSFEHDKNNFYR